MTRVILLGVGTDLHAGFGEYAHRAGWFVYHHGAMPESPAALVGPWEVSGLLVGHFGPEPQHAWKSVPVPMVSVGYLPQWAPKVPQIRLDSVGGARLAAEYVIERGFRHLAVLRGGEDTSLLEGVRLAFEAAYGHNTHATLHTLDWWASPAARKGWQSREVRRYIVEAITPLPRPLVIITSGNGLPLETVEALLGAGISVPHEVAIMGYQGTPEVLDAAPVPISRVDLDPHTRGYQAARLLDKLMRAGKGWRKVAPAEPIVIRPKGIVARASTDTTAVTHPKVALALKLIWEDYRDRELTASSLARTVGLSHYGLNKAFRSHMGTTIGKVLNQTRLKHAKRMLVETNLSAKSVASACGYSNWYTLARALRTETDLSPRQWRLQERKALSGDD